MRAGQLQQPEMAASTERIKNDIYGLNSPLIVADQCFVPNF